MYSLHRLFYFAVAVTFASAFIVPGSVRAGPGDCAAYSAADIDGCFLAWAEASGFDALTDNVGCSDNPDLPDARMQAFIGGASAFGVGTGLKPRFGGEAFAFSRGPEECSSDAEFLEIPELHICRAEILRSFTWRQLCAQLVDRSPQN